MTFREDDCRIRTGDGAQNFAILRRIALNLIKQERSGKSSVNIRRQRAGWRTAYLEKLLGLVTHCATVPSCNRPASNPHSGLANMAG